MLHQDWVHILSCKQIRLELSMIIYVYLSVNMVRSFGSPFRSKVPIVTHAATFYCYFHMKLTS